MNEASSADAGTARWATDATVAAGLALIGLVSLPFIARSSPDDALIGWGTIALVVVAAGAQAWRRRHPVPALVVTASATAAYLAIGYPYGPITFAFALAVYSVARHKPLGTAAIWSVVAGAAFMIHLFTNDLALDGVAGLGPASAWVAIPFTIGAARRAVAEARARERAEADHRLVDAERLRLSQEVHDVVGHGLAAIQMQADIALHVRRTRPGQAELALEAISKASSEALEELRATLAAIGPVGTTDADSRAPTPGLARLDDLCDRVRTSGVEVDLDVVGQRRALLPALDLAAYRILQESLTNVVKHSAHPSAVVHLAYDDDGIILSVTNGDMDAESHRDGFGIAGMRRRATQLGGELTAGPGPAPDTFRVHATLPTPDQSDQFRGSDWVES